MFEKFKTNKNKLIDVEAFKAGLKLLILPHRENVSDEEFLLMFKIIDSSGDGMISMEEFQEYILQLKNPAWKAEKLRRERGEDPDWTKMEEPVNETSSVLTTKESKAGAKLLNKKKKPKKNVFNRKMISELYRGPKFFWRTQTKIDLVITQYDLLNCIVVTAGNEKLKVEYEPIFLMADKIEEMAEQSMQEAQTTTSPRSSSNDISDDAETAKKNYLSSCILGRLELEDGSGEAGVLNVRESELIAFKRNPGVEAETLVTALTIAKERRSFSTLQLDFNNNLLRARRSSASAEKTMGLVSQSITAFLDILRLPKKHSPLVCKLIKWAQSIVKLEKAKQLRRSFTL